jgi:hypothetical protein
MAIGQEPIQPIQAGATAQPLVTSASDVVTPDAVAQLTDGFRKGFITADDVVNRIGDVGKAQKKALLESLGEYVNPDLINSRLAAAKASTAQSNLQQQQATAAQGIVQPAANLAQTQIASQQAEAVYGKGGLETYQTLGPLYGESMPPNPDENDFKKAAQRGNEMKGQMMLADRWLQQIAPAADYTFTDAQGNTYPRKKNWQGIDVTPPNPSTGYPGSPAYWAYAKQLDQFLPKFHPARSQYFLDQSSAPSPDDVHEVEPTVPAGTHPASSAIEPLTDDQVRAAAVNKLGLTGDQAANMNARDLTTARTLIEPAQAPPAVAAAPAAAAVAPAYSGQGAAPGEVPIKPGQTVPEAREQLQKLPGIEQFAKAQPLYANFLSAAVNAHKTPAGEPTGTSDLTLGETYGKLLDPSATLREFKWDAIKKAIPWADEFSDAKNLILRTHTFPPQFRQRLVDDGFNIIENSEKAIAPKLQYAQKQYPGVLDSDEQGIANGVPFRQRKGYYQAIASSPAAAAGGNKRTVNIPGVGPVIVNF